MKLRASIFVLLGMLLLILPLFLSYNKSLETPIDVPQAVDNFIQTTPSLPRYMEGGYSPLGRSPVLDALLGDPFYMPQYAEIVAGIIKERSLNTDIYSLATALQIAAGMPTAPFSKEAIIPSTNVIPPEFSHAFPPSIARKIYSYWQTFIQIQQEVEKLTSVLSNEEKIWIREHYNRFFFSKQDSDAEYDFFTSESHYPLIFFDLASHIDLAKLVDCSRKLSVIAQDFYEFRTEFTDIPLEDNFVWSEKGLKLFISQQSHTEHRENADFFIDLGGYNTLYNNAGGTEGQRSLALHLDLKGHNHYHGQNFVQGCGFLGVGLLFCASGHNSYHADAYAQGCGFFGVGSLVNLEGHNTFTMEFGGQSFALFGFSTLWDKEGENTYLATQGMAQAASSTLGVAFLIDNQGHSTYTAGISGKGGTRLGGIGQGASSGTRAFPWLNNASFYGGVSFLYLGGGSNTLKTAWLGQGSAYFLGVGIVVAEGSNDSFEADYDSQGQGLHLAAGLLLKKGVNSHFKGGWGSLGVGGDRSVGMFISNGGNNSYEGSDHSIGSSRKPKALGVFIDLGGDNDYHFQKFSNTRLQFPQSPKEWSSALFLEVGNNSRYPKNVDDFTRGNDLRWGINGHSIGMAVSSFDDNAKEALFSKFHTSPHVPFPFDPINGWADNTAYQPLQVQNAQQLADEILTANYDRRRQIYESLDLMRFKNRKVDFDLSALLQKPADIPEDAFNYAVLWALRNKDRTNLDAIKQALSQNKFTSEYAEKNAVSLVGTYWAPESAPLLTRLMLADPSEEVRYFAALALALNLTADSKDTLQQGASSSSELVRYAIAKGLQESKNPEALSIAVSLFNDPSFYVRRAAGMTALSLGDKQGVSVVFDTFKYDTLDMDENYGDNIYSQLTNYLGVNYGLDKDAWISWWNEVKDTFKLPPHKNENIH